MVNEIIIREVADRLSRCSICKHPHRMVHLRRIPSNTKLSRYTCHLKFSGYIGSFLDGDILVDVFAFPAYYHAHVLEIIDKARKEEQIENNLGEHYERFQLLDEDNCDDWQIG